MCHLPLRVAIRLFTMSEQNKWRQVQRNELIRWCYGGDKFHPFKEYMYQFLVAWMCRHCNVEIVLHIRQTVLQYGIFRVRWSSYASLGVTFSSWLIPKRVRSITRHCQGRNLEEIRHPLSTCRFWSERLAWKAQFSSVCPALIYTFSPIFSQPTGSCYSK